MEGMMSRRFKKGFTLIELMIVIAIIAIIAIVAIPRLRSSWNAAQENAVETSAPQSGTTGQ